MFVGVERIEVHLPGIRSLKEKRKHIASLKDRLRSNLKLSVSETGHQELLQRSQLGICGVCQDKKSVEELFRKASSIMKSYPQLIIQTDGVSIERK
ncbi:MAG: DUF503 domain-containing protein [Elusimicrobia bacterium]|nr:DUF503 domain-containing protein [Elusimicrobiota bacterium]